MEIIRNIELDTYPLFSLDGYITMAKVLQCYDGDTCDIFLLYNNLPMHLKARMYGYDSPEMKPLLKDPLRDEKKKKALDARKRLWALCTKCDEDTKIHKHLIKVRCGQFDKYGRLLITAWDETENSENFILSINQKMIDEGHGYSYFGGTKE